MDLDKVYAVDSEAAEDGKWMLTRSGVEVKVAKIGNIKFTKRIAELQKPYISLLQSDIDCSDLINTITIDAMSSTILMDWKAESKGEPVPYTPELGKQYMTLYPDFKEDISILSASRANFKPEAVAGK